MVHRCGWGFGGCLVVHHSRCSDHVRAALLICGPACFFWTGMAKMSAPAGSRHGCVVGLVVWVRRVWACADRCHARDGGGSPEVESWAAFFPRATRGCESFGHFFPPIGFGRPGGRRTENLLKTSMFAILASTVLVQAPCPSQCSPLVGGSHPGCDYMTAFRSTTHRRNDYMTHFMTTS